MGIAEKDQRGLPAKSFSVTVRPSCATSLNGPPISACCGASRVISNEAPAKATRLATTSRAGRINRLLLNI